MEDTARNEAQTLLNLLNNNAECQRLRAERNFTLEKLSEEKGITVNDCKKLFSYAKVLYEL